MVEDDHGYGSRGDMLRVGGVACVWAVLGWSTPGRTYREQVCRERERTWGAVKSTARWVGAGLLLPRGAEPSRLVPITMWVFDWVLRLQ